MSQPILYESHCHTPLCHHAIGEPEEYAAVALARGLAGINITCHGPTPHEWPYCMSLSDWPTYLEICQRAADQYAGRVDVKTGIECDFIPSLEAHWRAFLPRYPLSHVLGSIHPHDGRYREAFWTGDPFEYQKTYFEHLALAAESRLFDTLSHPDIIKNVVAGDWDIEKIMPVMQRALDRIARAGTAMEINTSGRFKLIPEFNPGPAMLREMALREIPVVIGSDAHEPQRVGEGFTAALDLLEQCGYRKICFFIDRVRHDLAIEEARRCLKTPAASGISGEPV